MKKEAFLLLLMVLPINAFAGNVVTDEDLIKNYGAQKTVQKATPVIEDKDAKDGWKIADSGVRYKGEKSADAELAKKFAEYLTGAYKANKVDIAYSPGALVIGTVRPTDEQCKQLMDDPLMRKKLLEYWWTYFSLTVSGLNINSEVWVYCSDTRIASITPGKVGPRILWEL